MNLQDGVKGTVYVIRGRRQGLPKHESIADQQDMLLHRPGAGNAGGSTHASTALAKILSPVIEQVFLSVVARPVRHRA
jgi:hypothetical protein